MHPSLMLVERFEELLARPRDDTPYDYQTLFRSGGFLARRASQKKLGLLKKVDEALRAMLRPSERVVFLCHAVAHSFWESYFVGLVIYYLNRRALVLTNERIILIQIDSRRRPRDLRSQIPLGAVESLKRSGLRNVVLRLRSGARLVFVSLSRGDRKSLVELTSAAPGMASRERAGSGLEHLCPHCYKVVEGHPVECPWCRGAFKSWRKAGFLSLLFPGLGDIYLGHLRFAVVETLVAAFLWLSIVLAIVAPDPTAPIGPSEIATSAVTLFLFMHGVDAFATFHIAKKGHYPARAPDAPGAATAR